MKRFIQAIAAAFLLSGCQAAPTAVPAPAAPQAPLKVVSGATVRHLLDAAGNDACIWAVQDQQGAVDYDGHGVNTGNASLVGKGALIKAAYNRYVYHVPEDQMLVVNGLQGSGCLYLDGYPVSVGRDIHFVFGAGEDVVFRFAPGYQDRRWCRSYCGSYYTPLDIEGFTVSPNLLGGVSSMLASEGK